MTSVFRQSDRVRLTDYWESERHRDCIVQKLAEQALTERRCGFFNVINATRVRFCQACVAPFYRILDRKRVNEL